MEVLLDLRCLQDPLLARRGIGRHAETVLRHARSSGVAARLTGLVDPRLPALAPDLAMVLHGVRHTAYTGALARRTALVSFSPFTHDPLFTARLLHHPAVLGVAVVDAVPPLDGSARSVPGAEARLDHHVSLRWLARNTLFLPTSEAAGAALQRVLGVRPEELVVTGGMDAGGQPPAWDDCGPAGVAQRFWDAVLARTGPRPRPCAQRGARPRLAVVLPAAGPDADYGRALCAALAGAASVDTFGGTEQPPSPLPYLSSGYDRVLAFGDIGLAARRHLLRYGGAWLGDLDGAMPDAELRGVAEPVLLHAPAAVRALGGALHLPCGLSRPAPVGLVRHEARARLAGAPGQAVLAVLDPGSAGDALQDCVWALDLLRAWGVDARLHILSRGLPDAVRALCASLDLEPHVWSGWGEAARYGHLQGADLALDVRAGVHFGAPLALVEGLAAGLRSVASASLVEAAGAPPHAHAVPDPLSPVRLAEAVMHALDQPPVTEAEREAYAASRGMDRTAARLLELLGLAP